MGEFVSLKIPISLVEMIYDENPSSEGDLVSAKGTQHQLKIHLFGGLQISLNAAPIGGTVTDKAKSLLAYLAVEADRPHRREVLAETFWPERPQGTARNNLRQALLALRLSLGEKDSDQPYLLPTNDEIQFNAHSRFYLDTREFDLLIQATLTHDHERMTACSSCEDRLQRAVGCYQDDFLIEASLPDIPEFESWVVVKRESYRRDLSLALRTLISMHEERNDYLGGSDFARQLVELEPWDEGNHRILMRLLAMGGMRSAALKQYQACKRVLAAEFRIEPSRETTELYNAIRYERMEKLREDSASRLAADRLDHLPPLREGLQPQSVSESDRGILRSRPWRWQTALLIIGVGTAVLVGGSFLRGSDFTTGSGDSLLAGDPEADPPDGAEPDAESVDEGNDPIPIEDMTGNLTIPTDEETLALGLHGLLPSEACGVGERLLYIEDFQDGEAPEWQEIALQAQGWGLVADPSQSENFVAVNPNYPSSPPEGVALTILRGFILDQAVARVWFMPTGRPSFGFHWHYVWEQYQIEEGKVDLSAYNILFNPARNRVLRTQAPPSNIILQEMQPTLWSPKWHLIEIATFDGQLDIWIDGVQLLSYIDPKPLPPGALTMAVFSEGEDQSRVYFDDITVCELTAPFVSITATAPESGR
jgi:DNA-binding SARP family transcriptional activator